MLLEKHEEACQQHSNHYRIAYVRAQRMTNNQVVFETPFSYFLFNTSALGVTQAFLNSFQA